MTSVASAPTFKRYARGSPLHPRCFTVLVRTRRCDQFRSDRQSRRSFVSPPKLARCDSALRIRQIGFASADSTSASFVRDIEVINPDPGERGSRVLSKGLRATENQR